MNTRDSYWYHSDGTKTHAFTPRFPWLQQMNGWRIKTPPTVDMIKLVDTVGMSTVNHLIWLFQINKLDLCESILTGKVGERRLGKWLGQAHYPEHVISRICAARIEGVELTISTRYKDFARMSCNPELRSCLAGDYRNTIAYYLHKPNVFLLISRNHWGGFAQRVVGRLSRVSTYWEAESMKLPMFSPIILFNRVYGPHIRLPDMLDGIPCFQQPHREESNCSPTIAISMETVRFEGRDVYGPEPGGNPGSCTKIYDDLAYRRVVFAREFRKD